MDSACSQEQEHGRKRRCLEAYSDLVPMDKRLQVIILLEYFGMFLAARPGRVAKAEMNSCFGGKDESRGRDWHRNLEWKDSDKI